MWIQWLIFLHVLGAISFFLAHGASAAMVFRLRQETELSRIRAMFDLSSTTFPLMFGTFLLLGITGLILPFLLQLWGEIWIWASIVLMLYVTVYMSIFNRKTYNVVRRMAGMDYMEGNKPAEAVDPAPVEEVTAFIQAIPIRGVVIVGYVIPVIVLWLMIFRPF